MGSINTPKFTEGEAVLCLHGPVIYCAKILEKEYNEEVQETDAWLLERRVLKLTEENLKRKEELKLAVDLILDQPKKSSSSRGKKGKASATVALLAVENKDTNSEENIRKKIKGMECVEAEALFNAKQEVQFLIPEGLKLVLVDDWDAVTRQKRLVKLPAKISIEQIFQEYLMEEGRKEDKNSIELCIGLGQYFNLMIQSQLLYWLEKPQFYQMLQQVNENPEITKMSEICGARHLMRLFSKLGGCLTYTNMDAEAISAFRNSCKDFFKFLLKNFDKYFAEDDYEVAGSLSVVKQQRKRKPKTEAAATTTTPNPA